MSLDASVARASNWVGRDDQEPVSLPVAEGWAARHPTASLDILRQNAWHSLKGSKIPFKARNRDQHLTLTGKEATKITNTFFGEKWVGGCVDRIIAIVRDRDAIDVANASGMAVEKEGMPEELRTLMGSLRDVKSGQRSDATNWLQTNLALMVLGITWEKIRHILSPRGDRAKRAQLLSFCVGSGDHSAMSWNQCIETTREMICNLADFDVNDFESTMAQIHLPTAVVQYFGAGALLFLLPTKDPYRQIRDKRTAMGSPHDTGPGEQPGNGK